MVKKIDPVEKREPVFFSTFFRYLTAFFKLETSIHWSLLCLTHGGLFKTKNGSPKSDEARRAFLLIFSANGCVASTSSEIFSFTRKFFNPAKPPKPPVRNFPSGIFGFFVVPASELMKFIFS